MVTLNPNDRKLLLSILENLPEMEEEQSRKHLLMDSGLGDIVKRINVCGSPAKAARSIINFLCQYGRKERNCESLASFLLVVQDLVGIEGKEFIYQLLENYRMMESRLPNKVKNKKLTGRSDSDIKVASRSTQIDLHAEIIEAPVLISETQTTEYAPTSKIVREYLWKLILPTHVDKGDLERYLHNAFDQKLGEMFQGESVEDMKKIMKFAEKVLKLRDLVEISVKESSREGGSYEFLDSEFGEILGSRSEKRAQEVEQALTSYYSVQVSSKHEAARDSKESESFSPKSVCYEFVLTGSVEETYRKKLEVMVKHLGNFLEGTFLTLEKVE